MNRHHTDTDYSMGSPEAWDPVERNNLEHNFLPIDQFSSISENDKIFLCGRRGAGKSAIALMLERNPRFSYTEAVQGEVQEYGAYMDVVRAVCRQKDAGRDIDVKTSIRQLWRWVLPVKAMQLIVARTIEQEGALDENIETIWNYLASLPEPINEESSIGHLLSVMFRNAVRQLQDNEDAYDAFLIDLTNAVAFRNALSALRRVTERHKALLVLDTLESYRIFEGPMIEGLKGIMEAANGLRGDKTMENVSIKFFMPAEIFDSVSAGFPGKVTASAVLLRWSTPDLITMLSRRFLDVLSRTEALEGEHLKCLGALVGDAYQRRDGRRLRKEFWYENDFLPKQVINRCGVKEDCFAYMFRHSQRRPRDLLAQMQSIITESRKSGEFPYISESNVRRGVHNESTLLQILGDALTPYEGLLPSSLVESARAAFYERPRIMSGRDMKHFAKELYNLHPLETLDPDLFVMAMLKCGVIGLVRDEHKAASAAGGEFYCKADFRYVLHNDLPLVDRFLYCVHPVMGDIFHMASLADDAVIYPLPSESEGRWLEQEAAIV